MAELFTNLASTRLASAVSAIDTTLTVLSGDGDSLFPDPSGGDFFRLVLLNKTTGETEIVACTSRSADVLTVTRAYEASQGNDVASAKTFNVDDLIELRPTAGFFGDLSTPTSSAIQAMDFNYAVDTGSANQYAFDLDPAAASYASPMFILFLPANTNTGASTLNVNSLGVKNIKLPDGTDPAAGDIAANSTSMVVYDDGDGNFKLLNPRVPLSSSSFAQLTAKNTFTKTNVFARGTDMGDGDISAGTLTIPDDGNYYELDSTTAITAIATIGIGAVIKIRFLDVLTLTHDGDYIVLPGGANIDTVAGDEAEFVEYAVGKWRVTSYLRSSGGVVGALPDGTTATTQAAGDSSTKVATTEFVQNSRQKFESGELTLTGTLQTVAHGLGAIPHVITCKLICKTSEGGYSAGDEVFVNPAQNDEDEGSGARSGGLVISPDASDIYYRATANRLSVIGKGTGYGINITYGYWRLKIVAIYFP